MGINLKFINFINSFFTKNIKINLTFLNLVNSNNLRLRLTKRKKLNRYDKFKINFYNKVQKGYLKLSKNNKKKYIIINSNETISYNKKKILTEVKKFL